MKGRSIRILLPLLLVCAAGVNISAQVKSGVQSVIESVRKEYAPDKSLELFDVSERWVNGKRVIKGTTTSPAAREMLFRRLRERNLNFEDGVRLLPDEKALDGKSFGVINISVANLRAQGKFTSGMVTQALLGTPVRILERDGWVHIQTPDRYLSWIHRMAVVPMTQREISAWNRSEKIVITAPFGLVYSHPSTESQTVSDVVAGDRLKYMGDVRSFYKVMYPDGRIGYVDRKLGKPLAQWRKELKNDANSILRTARTYIGFPYLWAGMSAKGVDCSGFVRAVLFQHDIIIPRDASQQAHKGVRIEIPGGDFSEVRPGDLVFFGRKAAGTRAESVSHVGFYLGNKMVIHSLGDVHISNFDKDNREFDKYNYDRLLYAMRVLPYIGKDEDLNTTASNAFYLW